MKHRIFTVLLASLMLLGLLASCATDPVSKDNHTSSGQDESDVYGSALAALDADWKGDDFVVLGRNDAANSVTEISRDESSSDPLEDAVYHRNLYLSEKCNLNYIARLVSTSDLLNSISNDIKSDSGEYDIVFPNMLNAGNMATKNMLMDFNDLSFVDLDADWWDQGSREVAIAGKVFWMNSDINFLAHDVTFLTLFSKVMAENQELDNLYQIVLDQEWTLDVFASYIKRVSADVDGNGKYDEEDTYGLIGTSTMGYNMFYAADLKFVDCDENGEPYLALTDSDMIKANVLLDKLLDIMYNGHNTYILAAGMEAQAKEMFANNQGLFYVECASYIVGLRNMSDDFGVIPLPKYNKAQEKYTTYVHSISSTMVVPQGSKNYEEMSKVIESMAILSGKYVIPTYYDLVLKRKTIRDEDSAGMLDIIFSNRTYDLVNYYEKIGLMHAFQDAVNAKTNSFSSTYNKSMKKAERELQKILDKYEDLD